MLRSVAIACVLALSAGRAAAAELPRAIGMYPARGPALVMVDSAIEVTVRGPIAEVLVTQRFENRADHATEATYIFPLPADAAVSAMSIKTGARVIRGAIERREDALRRYEAAIRQGVGAALFDQERPDVFTQTVAAIPAKGVVEVTLRYDTLARRAVTDTGGAWELVLPMVVAPRYVPGAATARPTTGSGRAPDTDRAPDASRVTPPGEPGAGGATTVTVRFSDDVLDPVSPTHELRGAGRQLSFTDPKTDHDAIVRWRSRAPAAGWVEAGPDGGYAAVVVEAPPPAPRRAALRCVLALDRSAAARGDADAVARPFVRALLAGMTAADRVAVIGSDRIAWSAPADAARAIEQAWPAAAGAFDLSRVLAAARPDGAPILLVSSALVADDAAAIAAAKRLGVPIHVIGVGPAPARGLLGQLATATGGTARYLAPGDPARAAAAAVLADAATAPAPLAVNWGALAARDVVPGTLPRLGAGQATIVLARVARAQPANARARGDLFAIELQSAPRTVDGATSALGPLARRWARARLDELLAAGAPPADVAAHALRYGLVSPQTSLVAIGQEIVVAGGVKRSVAVPVSVPAGMRWQAVKKQITVDSSAKDESSAGRVTKRAPAKEPPRPVTQRTPEQPAPPQAPSPVLDDNAKNDRGAVREIEPGEVITVEGRSPVDTKGLTTSAAIVESELESMPGSRDAGASFAEGRFRISSGLGAGIALSGGDRAALAALSARLEVGSRTLAGASGSLWLLSGDGARDTQGQLLATLSRRGLAPRGPARWLELGAGLGIHVGAGLGPAASASLRFQLPPAPGVAAYLRYDAARLRTDDDLRYQHAITLGLEYGF